MPAALLALLLLPAVEAEVFEADVPVKGWPKKWPAATERFTEPAFAVVHLPWRYVGTGVRARRASPLLVRLRGSATIPAGRYRVLVRSRGAARLLLDGKLVVALPAPPPMKNGHNSVRHDALDLGPTRRVGVGDREKLGEVALDGKPHTWELQLRLGGKEGKSHLRVEPGESLAALAPAGTDDFFLLGPKRMPLTDEQWDRYESHARRLHDELETKRREEALLANADELKKRRRQDQRWLDANPAPAVPAGLKGLPALNEVDHFLNARIARALAERPDPSRVDFHRDVQPVLAKHCTACHDKKPRGGLKLTDRKAARKGEEIVRRLRHAEVAKRMPPGGREMPEAEKKLIEKWVAQGADWPDAPRHSLARLPADTEPLAFLRRAHLDLVGTAPSLEEIEAFLADRSPRARQRVIDRLLKDRRHADAWVPYWQDALAENPNIVNPTLNNTGPFRWWIHEVVRDNKPWDVAVRELVALEGDPHGGGTAGFGMAAQNDAPFAARAGILAKAFLGVEMKCARCHDAPFHAVKQADLFHLAALLAGKPVSVPGTSTVPAGKLSRRPLITVTLKPGQKVPPRWTLRSLLADEGGPEAPRARLAVRITSAKNERFAQVMANRVWKRYMGRGLVESADDWENARPSHPELLRWLAWKFVESGYDLRALERLVVSSHAYQRRASTDEAALALFAAPARRRPWPEAMADTLFDSFGRKYDVGAVCLDLDSGRPVTHAVNFGKPRRAWEFAYLGGDRDRPSLDLPRPRAVTELLSAFGWEGSRQEPVTGRQAEPSARQAAVLANGTAARWLTRVSDDSAILPLALSAPSPEALVDSLFLRTLTRRPTAAERQKFVALLSPGFAGREVKVAPAPRKPRLTQPYITWANHLQPEANRLRLEEAKAALKGPDPTRRLRAEWRERLEDALWALLNAPELAYVP